MKTGPGASRALVACLALSAALACAWRPAAADDAAALYRQHCASCHGADRLGGMGPALLPENLGRLSRSATQEVIANGRHATQMPAFADKLAPAQIEALTALVHSALEKMPQWRAADI